MAKQSRKSVVRLLAPALGVDTDSAPAFVDPSKAPVLQNYLPGERGRVRVRGSLDGTTRAMAAPAKTFPVGTISIGASALIGYGERNTLANIIEPWRGPMAQGAGLGSLAGARAGAADAFRYDSAGPTAVDPGTVDTVPGPRSIQFGQFGYGIGYDGGASTTNDFNFTENLTRIIRWTGAVPPVVVANTPRGGQDLRVHYNRLLVLGGRAPDDAAATGIRNNIIWFTRALTAAELSAGITGTTAKWEDEVTAVDNSLELLNANDDFGVAFGAAGRSLAVFKRRSIQLLSGYGPETWALRSAVEGIGCIDPRSVVDAAGGCFFLSEHGYMFFDGTEVTDVSKGLHNTLLAAGLTAVGDDAAEGGFANAILLPDNFILLSIGRAPFTTGTIVNTSDYCGLFHIPSRAWSTFRADDFAGGQPFGFFRMQRRPGTTYSRYPAFDTAKVGGIAQVSLPEQTADTERGNDAGTNVATKWHSRLHELSSPTHRAFVHRLIIDYEWIVDGTAQEGSFIGPTVSVYNSHGDQIVTAFTLPSLGDNLLEVTRGRYVKDLMVHTVDIQVRIEYTSTARDLVKSSILDVFVEYDAGPEERGIFTTQ